MEDLDRFDRLIIHQLEQNSRITITELSQKVGLSKTPCQMRMKRLEEHGYIIGYTVILDHNMLGRGHIAFVQVKLNDTKSEALNAFNEEATKVPEIEQCHMIAGHFDYLLKVRTGDMLSYRKVLGEVISSLPHVRQTSTFVVMESVKDFGLFSEKI